MNEFTYGQRKTSQQPLFNHPTLLVNNNSPNHPAATLRTSGHHNSGVMWAGEFHPARNDFKRTKHPDKNWANVMFKP